MKFWKTGTLDMAYFGLMASLVFAAYGVGKSEEANAGNKPTRIIVMDKARMEVGDGDTIFYSFKDEDNVIDPDTGKNHSGKLRLLGYDTPETMTPAYGMFYNEVCGKEATEMAKKILFDEAKRIEIHTKLETDQYKRLLAYIVYYDQNNEQKLLAAEMIRRGLAFESIYHYGDNGFPKFYAMVDTAWKESTNYRLIQEEKAPYFLSPYLWRKLNLRHDLAVDGFDSWSEEKKDAWMKDELSKSVNEAQRRAEADRVKMVNKANASPGSKANKEVLFFLSKIYSELPRECLAHGN